MFINKITSAFGDHSSLLPLFTKDVVNSIGMTSFSYNAGGKIEAKDRFIDEFGTQAIWLGSLPFFKWAFDKSVYKIAKINPNIDVRLLKDKEQLTVAQRYAQTLEDKNVINTLNKAASKSKMVQGLFIGKFAAATALTLASFFTLVKVKQHYTKKQIEKQFWEKKSEQHYSNKVFNNSPAFKAFSIGENFGKNIEKQPVNNKNVSFKGLSSALQGFMFDPVKNLFIVDAGITGERLANSRTKTEFVETSIKEGSLLFFLYVAGRYVQKGIEFASDKLFKKPVDLHAEVLDSDYINKAIKSGTLTEDIQTIKNLNGNNKALFEYIYDEKNAQNSVIKAAKQSGTIKTIVHGNWIAKLLGKAIDTGIIDPHKYINPAEVMAMADNMQKLANKAPKDSSQIDKFLKSCRNMKIASVAGNMGITCLFLGVIVPYAMMKYRANQQNGNKDFHVQSEIEKQLEKNFRGRMA